MPQHYKAGAAPRPVSRNPKPVFRPRPGSKCDFEKGLPLSRGIALADATGPRRYASTGELSEPINANRVVEIAADLHSIKDVVVLHSQFGRNSFPKEELFRQGDRFV